MNQPRDIQGAVAAAASASGTIVGWQTQLEFWLRVGSLCVGIVAGLYTIYHYASRKR